jgi:hypothetical protein
VANIKKVCVCVYHECVLGATQQPGQGVPKDEFRKGIAIDGYLCPFSPPQPDLNMRSTYIRDEQGLREQFTRNMTNSGECGWLKTRS